MDDIIDDFRSQRSPAFSPFEHSLISQWAASVEGRGLRIETYADLYALFDEVLVVSLRPGLDGPWLVHKTPAGAVAVRLWPGIAKIVATVPEALDVITAAVGGDGDRCPAAAAIDRSQDVAKCLSQSCGETLNRSVHLTPDTQS